MNLYFPTWDEHDIPRVGCSHMQGKRIGSDFCQKQCPNLSRVINKKHATIIECKAGDSNDKQFTVEEISAEYLWRIS